MKHLIYILLVFLNAQIILAQCELEYTRNIKTQEIHRLKTKKQLLISEDYFASYIIIEHSIKGFEATVICSGNQSNVPSLEKDDQFMFVSNKGVKMPYKFIYDSEETMIKGQKTYTNTLKLDLKAIRWLSNNIIVSIRYVDMQNKTMYPYSLNDTRKKELKTVLSCFYAELGILAAQKTVTSKDTNNTIQKNKTAQSQENNITKLQDTTQNKIKKRASTSSSSLKNPQKNISFQIESTNKSWDWQDITLSQELAKKKYADAVRNGMKEESSDSIWWKNTKLGRIFFEQYHYRRALPYLIQAANQAHLINGAKKNKVFIYNCLSKIYFESGRTNAAFSCNKKTIQHLAEVELINKTATQFFECFLRQGKLLTKMDSSEFVLSALALDPKVAAQNIDGELKKYQINRLFPSIEDIRRKTFQAALLSFIYAEKYVKEAPKEQQAILKIRLYIAKASTLEKGGQLEMAKIYYSKALKIISQQVSPNLHPDRMAVQQALARLALHNKNFKTAYDLLEQSCLPLELQKLDKHSVLKQPDPLLYIEAINLKNEIKLQASNSSMSLNNILKAYDFAADLLLNIRKKQHVNTSKEKLITVSRKLSHQAIRVCHRLHQKSKDDTYLQKAFYFAELSKTSVGHLMVQDLENINEVPAKIIAQENGLKKQLHLLKIQLDKAYRKGIPIHSKKVRTLKEAIVSTDRQIDSLLIICKKKYPKYSSIKHNTALVSLSELQQSLASDELFLEYVVQDSFIYLLLIGQQEIAFKLTPLDRPIARLVKIIQIATTQNRAATYLKKASKLFELVLGDLYPTLKNKKLIIAPDAELNYIPFGILPINSVQKLKKGNSIYQQLNFLIEYHPICYHHSATTYLQCKNKQHKRSNSQIATWAPKFEQMNNILKKKGIKGHLTPLPGAIKEAQIIAKLFQNQAFLEKEATEAQFKKKAQDYSILHLATHGLLDANDPLSSSLILSNEGEEDGILTAAELYNMQLNADIAVLSACNSGMGKLSHSEGVIGVASGFAYAGVPNIIMSKWPVSDWSTSILMLYFYQNIKKGIPKAEALQQAKKAYLNKYQKNSEKLAPMYWGAFVLYGNNEVVEALLPLSTSYYGIILFLFISFAGLIYWRLKSKNS